MLTQRFDLFATAAEDERVTALEARNAQSPLRVLHEQLVNASLRGVMIAARFLADEHALRIAARAIEHGVGHESIVKNDVGLLEQLNRTQREQVRIARARADQINLADATFFDSLDVGRCRRRRRCTRRARRSLSEFRAGIALITREHARARRCRR